MCKRLHGCYGSFILYKSQDHDKPIKSKRSEDSYIAVIILSLCHLNKKPQEQRRQSLSSCMQENVRGGDLWCKTEAGIGDNLR